jgi:hypothetical protein
VHELPEAVGFQEDASDVNSPKTCRERPLEIKLSRQARLSPDFDGRLSYCVEK